MDKSDPFVVAPGSRGVPLTTPYRDLGTKIQQQDAGLDTFFFFQHHISHESDPILSHNSPIPIKKPQPSDSDCEYTPQGARSVTLVG